MLNYQLIMSYHKITWKNSGQKIMFSRVTHQRRLLLLKTAGQQSVKYHFRHDLHQNMFIALLSCQKSHYLRHRRTQHAVLHSDIFHDKEKKYSRSQPAYKLTIRDDSQHCATFSPPESLTHATDKRSHTAECAHRHRFLSRRTITVKDARTSRDPRERGIRYINHRLHYTNKDTS